MASTAAVPEPAKRTAAQSWPAPASSDQPLAAAPHHLEALGLAVAEIRHHQRPTHGRRGVGRAGVEQDPLALAHRGRPSGAPAPARKRSRMVRRVRDARHLRLLGGHLGEDEVGAVAAERPPHRLGDLVGVGQSRHRPVAGGGGQPVEADLARDRALIAGGAIHLVVEHDVHEVAGARGRRRGRGCPGSSASSRRRRRRPSPSRRARCASPRPMAEAESHGADHVEVLGAIAERERLPADVAVGVDRGLAPERLPGCREGGAAREARCERCRQRRGRARGVAAIGGRGRANAARPSMARLDDARRDEERHRLHRLRPWWRPPSRDRASNPVGSEHAVRNPEQVEQARRDLAHQEMFGGVLAGIAAPGHQEEDGRPYMSESEARAFRLVPSPNSA